jgi:hypothetical protein
MAKSSCSERIGNKMKLYVLRPTSKGHSTNWKPWYDKTFGYVLRAEDEKTAREMADKEAGDENRGEFMMEVTSTEKHPWLNPEYSICVELTNEGEAEIIITDHRSA